MIRGFLAGLFWGLVVAALGLGALSLGTARSPALQPVSPAQIAAAPAAEPAVPAVIPAEPAVSPVTASPAPAGEGAPPGLALPAAPVIVTPEPPAQTDTGLRVEEQPPRAAEVPAQPGGAGLPEPAPPRPAPEPQPITPDLPAAPAAPATDPVTAGPVILPVAPPPAVPPVTPDPPPADEAAAPVRPQPGFGTAVEGVRTGRLPRIGEAPAATQTEPSQAGTSASAALRRNARDFANPDAKPPFAVVLRDTGDSTVDLAALAAGDLAITLLIDPSAPGAAERAAIWRAAGQEVALLGTGLPRGGNAGDFEVAIEALASQIPQALAVVDTPEGGMQGDRMAAAALVPALQARGFGLVTWDRGLNAADQVARRSGLPAATIFRDLDSENESAPVIRRYLDRAAFKAQQDGRVLVLGRLRPETVAAVLEWALDGRSSALALAPLSVVLAGD